MEPAGGEGSHGAGLAQLPQLGVQAHEGPGHTQQSQEQASQDQDLTHESPKDYKADEGGCFKALSFGQLVTQQ